jgi:flagellar biosynthesis protein FlhG
LENKTSTRILAVTSGKGGVGKTNISVGTAIALAEEGRRVCLFDADLGLANINILLSLIPDYTLEDLMSGQRTLDEILIKNYNGIDIIPGSSGVEGIANLNDSEVGRLIEALVSLNKYDFLIFDTSAGIAAPVIAFCMAASEVLIIITPEPTSLTDAYALLKVLLANGLKGKAKIIVNQCRDIDHAKKIFQKFSEAVMTHLNAKISLTGIVLSDPNLTASVKEQRPFLTLYPGSKASKCVRHLAKTLLSKAPEDGCNHDLAGLWEQCFNIIKNPLSVKGVRRNNQDRIAKDGDNTAVQTHNEKVIESSPSREEGEVKGSSLEISGIDSSYRDGSKDQHGDPDTTPDNEMPVLIRELIRSVTNVSEELRMMRESIGKDLIGSKKVGLSQVMEPVRKNNAFILDYEEFQKKHHA